MATQTDKKSGKEFQFTSHATISASVAAGGTVNGKVARFVSLDQIPFRLKQGDQSSYFDITKIETGSIVRTDDGVVYIPYKKKNWQDMLIGNNSEIKTKFSNTAYLQVSAAFASKISNVDGDFLITQIAEEFYTATTKGFVGPVTASYELRTANGVTQSYSGIDTGTGVDFLLENNSTFSTHTFFQVGSLQTSVTQSIFFTSSTFNLQHSRPSSAQTSSFISTNHTYSTPVSGTAIGVGVLANINNSDANQGIYASYGLKMKMAGDADSGSFYTFAPSREIIIYNESHAKFEVSSGSFQYSSVLQGGTQLALQSAATGSGVFKTLYYHTGTAGPSGSYTGSLSTSNPLSSPLHGDAALRTTASYGYYNTPGTTDVYLVSSSNNFNLTPRFIQKATL